MNKLVLTAIIVATIVGSGSFLGGMQYQKSQSPNGNFARNGNQKNQNGNMPGMNKQNNSQNQDHLGNENRNGNPFLNGEITAKDDQSITLKTRDGSSKIVYFSNSTTVGKTVDGSASDLAIGQSVMVNGNADSSGAVTAQNIQIRPAISFQNQVQKK